MSGEPSIAIGTQGEFVSLRLIEPDGTRSRTQEETLSDKDRAWIAEQKKMRNLQ